MIPPEKGEHRGSLTGPREARTKAKARVTESKQESRLNVTKLKETRGLGPTGMHKFRAQDRQVLARNSVGEASNQRWGFKGFF